MKTYPINWTRFYVCKALASICQEQALYPYNQFINRSEVKHQLTERIMAQLNSQEILTSEIEFLSDDLMIPTCPPDLGQRIINLIYQSIEQITDRPPLLRSLNQSVLYLEAPKQ